MLEHYHRGKRNALWIKLTYLALKLLRVATMLRYLTAEKGGEGKKAATEQKNCVVKSQRFDEKDLERGSGRKR